MNSDYPPNAMPVSAAPRFLRSAFGYALVSDMNADAENEVSALREASCRKVFCDSVSSDNADRPALRNLLGLVQAGDLVIVTGLERFGRSLHDLVQLVNRLYVKGVGFASLRESISTCAPGGAAVCGLFAVLADFTSVVASETTRNGLAAARAQGRTGGRPTVVDEDMLAKARELLPNPEYSVRSIAALLGVSPGTLYNHIPELKMLRGHGGHCDLEADAGAESADDFVSSHPVIPSRETEDHHMPAADATS
ncbi:recombinase family protein [Salininema proteolyticum]|uniref:Recombinase family protein n=1 Tax=Salininema proteolyticum TaxID=1607685 RepID=A0ABV8U380_9ACTN